MRSSIRAHAPDDRRRHARPGPCRVPVSYHPPMTDHQDMTAGASAAMLRPIRWGLLGTGGITRKLLAGAATTPTADVVAVGSRTPERAAAFAAANGIERAHGGYEALLADPDVDAVYISLPNSLHHPWTMAALAAGKHVLCEKPYTRRPAEVDEAFDAADAAGLVLAEAFMWRHHPQADAMRALLPEIGQLQLIRATFAFVLDETENIRLRADLDGGA